MTDHRPLFDAPPTLATRKAKVKRRASVTPLPPPTPKPPLQSWTVVFVAAPDPVPGICRVKRFLKMGWRRYRIRAEIVQEYVPESLTSGASGQTLESREKCGDGE